jgi:hypothetical protein
VPFLGLEMLRLWDRVSPFVNPSVKRAFNEGETARKIRRIRGPIL